MAPVFPSDSPFEKKGSARICCDKQNVCRFLATRDLPGGYRRDVAPLEAFARILTSPSITMRTRAMRRLVWAGKKVRTDVKMRIVQQAFTRRIKRRTGPRSKESPWSSCVVVMSTN